MKTVVQFNIPAFQLQSADILTGPDIGVTFCDDLLLRLSLFLRGGGGGRGWDGTFFHRRRERGFKDGRNRILYNNFDSSES
jgi:hypothetical protein